MNRINFIITALVAVCAVGQHAGSGAAWSAVVPPPALLPLNQIPVPEPPNLFQFVRNKPAAIKLGKAFFWDMQTGSDGIQACASCHFSAGTDNRTRNTVNPGSKAGDTTFQVRNPDETIFPGDFPFHQRSNPEFQNSPVIRNNNDIVGSQGVKLAQFVDIVLGSAVDTGTPLADTVFNLGANPANADPATNTRRVTGRNTPSVINAIYNFNNFWDGRAHFLFNGVTPFGPADTSAGVWFSQPNGTILKQPVAIEFASLASQATGPPLNDTEMSFTGRTFPKLGRKLLSLTPLGQQLVHPNDSVLGPSSNAVLQPGNKLTGSKGLKTSYTQMIQDAFQSNLWDSPQLTPDGFTQIEANFSLFWGLAIQLYEATLVSDQTPFDRFLGGDQTALTAQQQDGFNVFFGAGRCDLCHFGTELTNASVRAAAFVNNGAHALIEQMGVASGQQIIYDNGYNNTAVTRTVDDIGRGDTAPFTNPLNAVQFPLSFSKMAELQSAGNLAFSVPILPGNLPANFPVAVDGTFKVPGLRNVELTAPYFHNGSMLTLDQVIDFYVRGGNFPADNRDMLDININEIGSLQNNAAGQAALKAFMLAMTDERVRNESAPFDHPELVVPNGNGPMTRLPAKDANGVAAPAVTLSIVPLASPTKVTNPVASGTMEIGSTVRVSINGGLPVAASIPAAGTWTAPLNGLAEGNNTVTVTATDAQNVATALTVSLILDTTPPALTIAAPATPTRGGSQTISGTMEAGVRPVISVNTNAALGPLSLNGTSWSCQVSGLARGVNTFTVTATDSAGNSASKTASLTVILPDGDLNGVGGADVAAALKALKIAAGTLQPTAEDLLHGDVAPLTNGAPSPDGKIDVADALLILRKAIGLVTF